MLPHSRTLRFILFFTSSTTLLSVTVGSVISSTPAGTENTFTQDNDILQDTANHGTKIYNGDEYQNLISFFVSLRNNSGYPLCGGSLIDAFHVLTAAGCVADGMLDGGFALIPTLDQNGQSLRKYNISHLSSADADDGFILMGGIALIRLQQPVVPAPMVCLGTGVKSVENFAVDLVGVGLILDPTNQSSGCSGRPNFLQLASGYTLKNYQCGNVTGHKNFNPRREVCTSLMNFNKTKQALPAPGDSGGPLFFRNTAGEIVQVGVLSFQGKRDGTVTCPDPSVPSYYIRPEYYRREMVKAGVEATFFCSAKQFKP